MTNRISDHLPTEPPDADGAEFAERHRTLRVLCTGLILFGCALLVMVSSVVWFGLGGGSLVKGGGVQVLTGVGAILTLTAVAVAVLVTPVVVKAGLRKVATEPPPPPEEGVPPDTETERLWKVYAQGKFVEYGLAEGAAIVTAVLFHLSADWLMLVFVAGMVAFQIVRFPTESRVRAWFTAARTELDRVRAGG